VYVRYNNALNRTAQACRLAQMVSRNYLKAFAKLKLPLAMHWYFSSLLNAFSLDFVAFLHPLVFLFVRRISVVILSK
jgi:hypothetical protein